MIMAGIVHAIAGEEIEDAAPAGCEQFAAGTSLVALVHLQQVEQPDPLRVDVFGVHAVERRSRSRGKHMYIATSAIRRPLPREV